MRVLTPTARQSLVVRIFATSTRAELHALELRIARNYAATPAQRAANDEQLEWLRNAAKARRVMVGRDGSPQTDQHSAREPGRARSGSGVAR